MCTSTLVILQALIGVVIVISGAMLIAMAVDRHSRFLHKAALTGLVIWGVWFVWEASRGRHDSPPALAFAGLVAFVVAKNGRQIRGILDGEPWWPPHAPQPKNVGKAK